MIEATVIDLTTENKLFHSHSAGNRINAIADSRCPEHRYATPSPQRSAAPWWMRGTAAETESFGGETAEDHVCLCKHVNDGNVSLDVAVKGLGCGVDSDKDNV